MTPAPLPPVLTPRLRSLLEHYRGINSPAEFQQFLDYLGAKALAYSQELSRFSAGPERAAALHRLLDAEIDKAKAIATTCTRGCSSCCNLEVEVTGDEAALLADLIREGYPVDRARLQLQAGRARNSADWSARKAANRCVFLRDDHCCGIYDKRPGACRKLAVVSHVSECTDASGKPVPVSIPLAELILSVALSLPDNGPRTLARALSNALHAPIS